MSNVTEELELKVNDVTVFKLTEDMTGINPLDGFDNIRDRSGTLRAVDVYWNSDGWYVYAYELDVITRNEGRQVFSRNYPKVA